MNSTDSHESDFERPLNDLRTRISELEDFSTHPSAEADLRSLHAELRRRTDDIFSTLTPWQKTLLARHFERPYPLDFVSHQVSDFTELHGDRRFGDDPSVIAGIGRFRGRSVVLVGHQKGRGTQERIRRNFGQPRPEGYRKALRVFQLAERFDLPILTLIDTPGAYPGVDGETRGQAEAIARNLIEMAALKVPIVSVVTGEGGSGGALALAVGDWVIMLEHSIYSVISPEGCAAILWKDQGRRPEAARALNLTAQDLLRLGIIDEIVKEPLGGAHTDHLQTSSGIGDAIERALVQLGSRSGTQLGEVRLQKFRRFGAFTERSQT